MINLIYTRILLSLLKRITAQYLSMEYKYTNYPEWKYKTMHNDHTIQIISQIK